MMDLEFTNCTLVVTEQGIERLVDLLERPVKPCLWAIRWIFGSASNGISFHRSHKLAQAFADAQIVSVPDGPARLVDVSEALLNKTLEYGDYWTTLDNFDDAVNYEEPQWNH